MEWKYVLESKRYLEDRIWRSYLPEIVVSVVVCEESVIATELDALAIPNEANPVSYAEHVASAHLVI